MRYSRTRPRIRINYGVTYTTAALVVLLLPVLRIATVGHRVAFQDRLDVYEYSVAEFLPLLFPGLIACLGIGSLNERFRSRFMTYARVRASPRDLLIKAVATAALASFILFLCSFLVAGLLAFYFPFGNTFSIDDPSRDYASPHWMARIQASNAYGRVLLNGTFAYLLVYPFLVAAYAALWSVTAALCVVHIRNNFLALTLPFLVYQCGNFAAGIVGRPVLSPISAVFPFNIAEHTWLSGALTPSLLLGVVAIWGWWTWRNAPLLSKLS